MLSEAIRNKSQLIAPKLLIAYKELEYVAALRARLFVPFLHTLYIIAGECP